MCCSEINGYGDNRYADLMSSHQHHPSPQQQPSKMNLGIFPNVRPHFTSEKTSGHYNTFPS